MAHDELWPLGAAATALLMNPKTSAHQALTASLKELVAVGAWTMSTTTRARWWGAGRPVSELRPGPRAVPPRPPLQQLSWVMHRVCPRGGLLGEVVQSCVKERRDLAERCRRDALTDLQARGLIRLERRWYGEKVVRTPTGDAWARVPLQRQVQWRAALGTGGPAAAAALVAATAAPGLALQMDTTTLQALDAEVRRLRLSGSSSGGGDSGAYADGGVCWDDLDSIDGLSGVDSGVDSGVSSSDSGTGSGGDGGGDGGGGGGD